MELKLKINTKDLLQHALDNLGKEELFKLLWEGLGEEFQQDWIRSHLCLVTDRIKKFLTEYDAHKEELSEVTTTKANMDKENYQALFRDKDFTDSLLKFLKEHIKLTERYGRTELLIDNACVGSITKPIDWTYKAGE